MRILWLNINSSYSHSFLSIPSLHAQLQEELLQKTEWRVITGTTAKDISYYISSAVEFNPHLILSTAWLFNIKFLCSVLCRIKAILTDCQIVLGGPEFLGDNRKFLTENCFVSAVFKGEGEEIFPCFIDKFIKNSDWKDLTGFCHIDSSGEYVDNGVSVVSDFKSLVPPESSCLFDWSKPFIQIETSRGCFNRCAFCISGNHRVVDNLSPVSVEKRVERAISQGIKEIRILDRTFNANPGRAILLLQIFNKFHNKVKFHLEIHPAFMNDTLRSFLSKLPGDLLHLEAGMQSLDQEVIDKCSREGDVKNSLAGLYFLINKTKAEVHTDLIAGLPSYYWHTLIADVKKLIELNPQEIQLELLKLLPGTKLRENAGDYGIIYSPSPPYEVLCTNEMTYHQMLCSAVLSQIIDEYYNDDGTRECFRNIVMENDSFLIDFVQFTKDSEPDFTPTPENRLLFLYRYCQNYYNSSVFHIIKCWMLLGLSFKKGPGKLSARWHPGDETDNPMYQAEIKSYSYRYLDFLGKRHWFCYNKYSNNYKPISYFAEYL